jgi:hypothetical protein
MKYQFKATLYPKRLHLSISDPIPFESSVPLLDGTTAEDSGVLTLNKGDLKLEFSTSQQNVDLATLKIRVEEIIGSIVNSLGYLSGLFYFADIESAQDENGNVVTFGLGAQEIVDTKNDRPIKSLAKIAGIIQLERSLPRILSDLRGAVIYANDTGFYCFRAVETIRAHFESRLSLSREAAWPEMRRALNLSRSWFDQFSTYALPQRHGARKGMSAGERVNILKQAWFVVDRFIVFIDRGFKDLPTDEFAVL